MGLLSQSEREKEREHTHTRVTRGVMDASFPPASLGYVRMTNSLRNNSFDWFIEERKLVMLPRIKLLLGLVLNFIKWISEKCIHIHFRPKSWIIKRIYNCTQFSPQAQPARMSSVHVTGHFMCFVFFFQELLEVSWTECILHAGRNYILTNRVHIKTQTQNSTVLYRGSCRILITHKYFPGMSHPQLILDLDQNMIKIIILRQHYCRH